MSSSASRRSQCFVRAQRESPAVALKVANGLLNLHALSMDALDLVAGAAMMGQRGGEQSRDTMQLSILRTVDTAFARPARSPAIGAHQIQPTPVAVTARQTSPADVTHVRFGLSVQRVNEAPAPRLRVQVFDSLADAPNPVPPKGLHVTKPRTAESHVGDHSGATALGQHRVQPLQESPVGLRVVVASYRMHFFVDRERAGPNYYNSELCPLRPDRAKTAQTRNF